MSTASRSAFQGLTNIVRFNWHYYALSAAGCLSLLWLRPFLPEVWQVWVQMAAACMLGPVVLSLLVSWYVYDASGLYRLEWLRPWIPESGLLVNIHAGFDETSALLADAFPQMTLQVLDFYDPALHTEISVKRARAAYPPFGGTLRVSTDALPLADQSAAVVCVLFAAHEIRDEQERLRFFAQLRRILQPGAPLIIAEHLRDLPNFLAYTIGFLHFMPLSVWQKTFATAGLRLLHTERHTAFIRIFVLTC